jgi:outer membrane protein OmpA-like peptidoglycan-associated protein
MAQVDNSVHQYIELNREETVQVEKFVKLLAELNIIDLPEYISQNLENEKVELPIESLPLEVCSAYLESYEDTPKSTTWEEPEIVAEYTALNEPENVVCTALEEPESQDRIAAFEKLQEILVGTELSGLEEITDNIKQKLTKLENQIYEPEALIELLLPCFAELFKLKITESSSEMVNALAPIIDSAIESRIEQNKSSMSVALAPVLPDAISQQISFAPQEMSDALAPTMGRAMKKQIEIEQDAIVDALYPIIGSTISKYMAETIRAINQQVEETFSVEGIKRKIRAKLQGVSEAELILKEALPFTAQAIFLIHKASGLVIADIQRSDSHQLESEMIAGMLTAIRSFANDCITQNGSVSELDAIDYGTSKIILEVAGYCYLAIVVRGEPTKEFIGKMRQTLISLVRYYGDSIEKFDGDSSMIPNQVNQVLETLNDNSQIEKSKRPSPILLLSTGLLSAILIPWGIWQYHSTVIRTAENQTALALASTPELAVYRLNVKENRGKLKLTGKVPNQALHNKAFQVASASNPQWSIDNQILAVEVPPDPVLTAAEVERVTAVLNQIDGVAISSQYINDKVDVEGSVNLNRDINKITQAFAQIPGVKLVSSTVQVKPLKVDVRFYFQENSADLIQADLSTKIQQVKFFLKEYPKKDLKIIGYSYSATGQTEIQQLALERAKAVKQALINQSIEPSRLQILGTTNLPPGIDTTQPTWLKRCVIIEPINK